MLVSAMLFYHKLTKVLLSYGFEQNPYNLCVVNKIVNGDQLTICWHVDSLESSYIDPKVNNKFLQWIKDTFRQLGEVKMTQGPLHDYLGITLDYSLPGQVSFNMSHYVKKMVKEFPQEISREHQWPHCGMKTCATWQCCFRKGTSQAIPHSDHARTVSLQVWSSGYCTSNSLPNYMGTKTKSHRLDQVMSNAVISQANSEGQISLKSRWLWMPLLAL